jgi:periplasmic copper chaperone A
MPRPFSRKPCNTATMTDRRRLILSLAGLLALPATARAHSYTHGAIAIGHAWALPSEISGEGQAFVPIVNMGKKPDELLAARSSVCTQIELRRNNRYDDPPLSSFVLEPGKPLPMRPTARHLRLMGLKGPLLLDQRFTVILDFLNAGETEIEFHVEKTPGD